VAQGAQPPFAGRVQSVALRLVGEREREIEIFVPVEYWSLDAELAHKAVEHKKQPHFKARLARIGDKEADLRTEADVQAILDDLEAAEYVVSKVKEGQRTRRPSPPYTTSTLQQEASRKLGFTASRTMRIAQQLLRRP
jgi:DNA topoisomerase-1